MKTRSLWIFTLLSLAFAPAVQAQSDGLKNQQFSLEEQLTIANQYCEAAGLDEMGMQNFKKAESAYGEILKEHPDNLYANLNLGLMYYNHAVSKIRGLQTDSKEVDMHLLHKETSGIFQMSLPHILKANEIDSGNKHILTALSGIYYALQDMPTYHKYQNELKGL